MTLVGRKSKKRTIGLILLLSSNTIWLVALALECYRIHAFQDNTDYRYTRYLEVISPTDFVAIDSPQPPSDADKSYSITRQAGYGATGGEDSDHNEGIYATVDANTDTDTDNLDKSHDYNGHLPTDSFGNPVVYKAWAFYASHSLFLFSSIVSALALVFLFLGVITHDSRTVVLMIFIFEFLASVALIAVPVVMIVRKGIEWRPVVDSGTGLVKGVSVVQYSYMRQGLFFETIGWSCMALACTILAPMVQYIWYRYRDLGSDIFIALRAVVAAMCLVGSALECVWYRDPRDLGNETNVEEPSVWRSEMLVPYMLEIPGAVGNIIACVVCIWFAGKKEKSRKRKKVLKRKCRKVDTQAETWINPEMMRKDSPSQTSGFHSHASSHTRASAGTTGSHSHRAEVYTGHSQYGADRLDRNFKETSGDFPSGSRSYNRQATSDSNGSTVPSSDAADALHRVLSNV